MGWPHHKEIHMTTISILGKGNMGSAIAGLAEKAGHTVEVFDTSSADKPVTGDVVVLAVPHPAVADIVAQRADQLAGKVVVDITNPLDYQTGALTVPADSSSAAQIAEALPTARVLKAFNTNFGPTVASGTVGDQPTTVLIAGDDDGAKTQLAEIITASGLNAVDAGPLARARELESLALLQIGLAMGGKTSMTGGFALHS
jgi:predicted dinucleotide-binding enzyme